MKFSDAATLDARARLLGERLTDQRLQRNLSQAAAASRAGVSRDAVQRAEKGRGTVDTFLRLLAAYGLADQLEMVLPEREIGPAELLAAQRPRARKRAPRTAAGSDEPSALWVDEP